MNQESNVLATIGECIYCGATDGLTDEHIVPLALGGDLILADSSCKACAKITGRFEQQVLRGFMLDGRTAGNFPTRRPHERPLRLAIARELLNKRFEQLEVMAANHPGFLHLPLLEAPAVLNGGSVERGTRVKGFETIRFGSNPLLTMPLLNTNAIQVHHRIHASAFARMIAKIGYCFAVSQHGLIPRENVLVLPDILGESDRPSHWLGSVDFSALAELDTPRHVLATAVKRDLSGAIDYLIARVKLFSSAGATGYEVVIADSRHVGSLKVKECS